MTKAEERELKLNQVKALREYADKLETQVRIQDELDLEYDKDMVKKIIKDDVREFILDVIVETYDITEIPKLKPYLDKYNISYCWDNPIDGKIELVLFERKGDK